MTEKARRLYFVAVFALAFYGFGASFVQSFVNYATWKLIGAAEFKAYHQAMGPLIVKTMVVPWVVEIVLTVALLRLRPRAIPRWAIFAALALIAVNLVSTIAIQIPIQARLDEDGLSPVLVDRLVESDRIRLVSSALRAGLYVWTMTLVVRTRWTTSELIDPRVFG